MSSPVTIDVPHRLGQAGARERLRTRVGELAGHIPGGMADVTSSWSSENEMVLDIAAMGQRVAARLEVMESVVRVHLVLPPMLALFSGLIGAAVRDQGGRLLEDRSG